jgi:hypothetical protein
MESFMEMWDEDGLKLAAIPYATLKSLAPLTDDPDATLKALGLDSAELKSALLKVVEVLKKEKV